MISAETITWLEERGINYIIGGERALRRCHLLIESERGKTQHFVKKVKVEVEVQRHIVWRNEAEVEKDWRDRQAIVATLQDALRHGRSTPLGQLHG
jgi:hypothetical protein